MHARVLVHGQALSSHQFKEWVFSSASPAPKACVCFYRTTGVDSLVTSYDALMAGCSAILGTITGKPGVPLTREVRVCCVRVCGGRVRGEGSSHVRVLYTGHAYACT
jgi:hypothetical protein